MDKPTRWARLIRYMAITFILVMVALFLFDREARAQDVDRLAMLMVLERYYDGLDRRPGHDRIPRAARSAFFRRVYRALDKPCAETNNLTLEAHDYNLYLAVPDVDSVWARFKPWKIDIDEFEDIANREVSVDPNKSDRFYYPLRDFLIEFDLSRASAGGN